MRAAWGGGRCHGAVHVISVRDLGDGPAAVISAAVAGACAGLVSTCTRPVGASQSAAGDDAALDVETVRAAVESHPVLVVARLGRHGGDRVGRDVRRVRDDREPAAQVAGVRREVALVDAVRGQVAARATRSRSRSAACTSGRGRRPVPPRSLVPQHRSSDVAGSQVRRGGGPAVERSRGTKTPGATATRSRRTRRTPDLLRAARRRPAAPAAAPAPLVRGRLPQQARLVPAAYTQPAARRAATRASDGMVDDAPMPSVSTRSPGSSSATLLVFVLAWSPPSASSSGRRGWTRWRGCSSCCWSCGRWSGSGRCWATTTRLDVDLRRLPGRVGVRAVLSVRATGPPGRRP